MAKTHSGERGSPPSQLASFFTRFGAPKRYFQHFNSNRKGYGVKFRPARRTVTSMSAMGRIFGFLLILAVPVLGADKWIRLSTPNFELYTNDSIAAGQETIRYCEQLRSFFVQLPEYQQRQLSPVRIVEFSSAEQFRPYKATEWEPDITSRTEAATG